MQTRSLALRALKSQASKRTPVAASTPDTPHVFGVDEVDVGKYGWDYYLLVERDERKELLDSLLEFYQQYLFKMSAKHPAALYTLIEIHKDGRESVRHENCNWVDLFRVMTDTYRIRGVKPMYAIRTFLHDLQGQNVIPREDRRCNMFEDWLHTEFPAYRNKL